MSAGVDSSTAFAYGSKRAMKYRSDECLEGKGPGTGYPGSMLQSG